MSKYMDKNSFDFLIEFLNSEKQHIVKFDDVEGDESGSEDDESESVDEVEEEDV